MMSKFIDLTNKRYGRLVVAKYAGKDSNGKTRWACVCDCGAEVRIFGTNLKRKLTTSCGCFHKEQFRKLRLIKIDRRRKFGKLKAIGGPTKKGSKTFYLCKCDCGNTTEVESYVLRKGITKSCGCLQREAVRTHGLSQTKDYKRAKCAERRFLMASEGNNYTVSDIVKKLMDQKYLCYYCEGFVKSDYHVDHMTPLSRGGNNEQDNICISCPTCNLRKNRKTAEEFINSGSDPEEND